MSVELLLTKAKNLRYPWTGGKFKLPHRSNKTLTCVKVHTSTQVKDKFYKFNFDLSGSLKVKGVLDCKPNMNSYKKTATIILTTTTFTTKKTQTNWVVTSL